MSILEYCSVIVEKPKEYTDRSTVIGKVLQSLLISIVYNILGTFPTLFSLTAFLISHLSKINS